MFCIECGNNIGLNAKFCGGCGASQISTTVINTPRPTPSSDNQYSANSSTANDASNQANLELKEYYSAAFAKIDAANGNFTVVFNWASFLFGIFWYLYKGMWQKALVLLFVAIFTPGYFGFLFIIYTGLAGTYDLYLWQIKKRQMW